MRRPRKERKEEDKKQDRKADRRLKGGPKVSEKKTKYIATHTITDKDTLSHVALKYYGNATRPYFLVIYEANKAVIGDDPAKVVPGMELNIPELPEELKKK